jgi:hypothetical protein
MIKKRRTYTPRIVGGKVMMPADLRRLLPLLTESFLRSRLSP